jgi:Holliday junction resolvase RusA-like endonuclease
MEYKITVHDIAPSLNIVINKAKRHWAIYASMKKAWKKLINDAINPNWYPFLVPVTVTITLFFDDKRARDIDNYITAAKFCCDGLTKKENPEKFLIPDDNENWVKDVTIRLRKGEPKRTEIVIKEVENDKTLYQKM